MRLVRSKVHRIIDRDTAYYGREKRFLRCDLFGQVRHGLEGIRRSRHGR